MLHASCYRRMADELYLSEVFEDSIEPLLANDYHFTRNNLYSAAKATERKMNVNEGWQHADASTLVGWVKLYGNSHIAYLQGGHDGDNYADKNYQRLLQNAVHWVASDQALNWARTNEAQTS